jgi:protein-S-isoprenylcysteine O-methyltransferase Ste14
MTSESIARLRVPIGWLLGLLALWIAQPTGGYLVAGMAVSAMGEALRLWASGYLEKDRRLATAGPYAWTRNPLYLGSFFVGVGFTLATGRIALLFLLVALFAAVYVPVMKREATRLEASFPGDYSLYAARVPLLIPRVPREQGAPGASFCWSLVFVNREPVTVIGVVLVVVILWAKWRLAGS